VKMSPYSGGRISDIRIRSRPASSNVRTEGTPASIRFSSSFGSDIRKCAGEVGGERQNPPRSMKLLLGGHAMCSTAANRIC
jgi:hypothetical protein